MADLSSPSGRPVPPPRPSGVTPRGPPLPPRVLPGARRQSDTPRLPSRPHALATPLNKSLTFAEYGSQDKISSPTQNSSLSYSSNSSSAPATPQRPPNLPRKQSLSRTPVHGANKVDTSLGDTYVIAEQILPPHMTGGANKQSAIGGAYKQVAAGAGKQPALGEQDWYWPEISKEDVTEIMKDMHDGAFLVRDAARVPGYYTLTLRKSGVNRLIRIMHREGLYGFAEPLEFPSVIALIDYYRTNSLAPYSPKLDITLGMAVSRSGWMQKQMTDGAEGIGRQELTADKMLENLRKLENELKEMSKKYNTLKQQFERTNEEIRNMRIEITAQKEIILIMDEGLKEHERHHSQCSQAQKAFLLANFDLLRRRYRVQRDGHDDLNQKLRRSEMTKNYLDMELNNLKPNLKRLQVEKGNILRFLQQRGWRNDEINARIERIEASSTGEEVEEDEGLYATYAMLHTYRNESDYQRITQELRERGLKRPPPLPEGDPRRGVMSNPAAVSVPSPQGGPGSRALPSRETFRDRGETVVGKPLSRSHDFPDFNQQLISYKDINVSRNLPHFEQSAWMNPSISREGSRDMLTGKANGTFLVRPKANVDEQPGHPSHTHTIDIVDGGKFKRIPVYRDPAGGYGFASPFEFDSLLSLVLYYATNTMEKHNPDLETMLRYPAFYVDRGR